MTWPTAFVFLALMICNLLILGTTAYAVFWLGHSGWWFALALMMVGGSGDIVVKASGKDERS